MIKRSFIVFLFACGTEAPSGPMLEPKPPGLESDPKWLTYTCVEPGCDTTLSANVTAIGDRDIAVKRIVLSDRDRTDFIITTVDAPPFILDSGSGFAVDVRYAPTGDPRLGDLDLRITFTDAAASETDDRVQAGELAIPLVRRQIGEPRLTVDPPMLDFGPVLPTAQKTLPLTISNTGFGNVGLVIDRIEIEPEGEVTVTNLPPAALIAGESFPIDVVYAPQREAYLEGTLTIVPVAETVIPTVVPIVGTSISHASLLIDPKSGIDFGEVAVGGTAQATLQLINRGAEDLVIHHAELAGAVPGANLTLALVTGSTTATIAALESVDVDLSLEAISPGEIDTFVRITSSDREQPIVDVPVIGLITKPIIEAVPGSLDFGAVPRGWTLVHSIEVSNSGYGDLVITNLGLILGSSELFTVRTVPTLPMMLRHDQRTAIEIEFRSEAEAVFNATLSIDSNDADRPFIEIPISATGASCDAGCPIANGTPDCGSGLCEVGSCNADWYDADLDPASGCECREIGSDPGEFCAEGVYLGSLDDDGDATTYVGILPASEDVDVIRFFANDGFQFGSDDFDVRATLESTDPGIQFCAYRHDTGDHLSECFWENERCPTDRAFRKDGSSGPSDSADFSIKVFRDPTIAPTCTTYTLFLRNG
jgi:hypothetical protein